MFSTLQNLSPWTPDKELKWMEARKHIQFVIKVYRMQLEAGRWFLHEHPAKAMSWDLKEIRKLGNEQGVLISEADQCMYGLTTWDADGSRRPAQKRTKFMTNSPAISAELQRKCRGAHKHQQTRSYHDMFD